MGLVSKLVDKKKICFKLEKKLKIYIIIYSCLTISTHLYIACKVVHLEQSPRSQYYGTFNTGFTFFFFYIVAIIPSGQKNYTQISNALTWVDAQIYCRTHYTDLAMIENAEENTKMLSVVSAGIAWIGLHRKPWRWSDQSKSSFRNWQSEQPNNYGGKQWCIAENSKHHWEDIGCDEEFSFLCHGGKGNYNSHILHTFLFVLVMLKYFSSWFVIICLSSTKSEGDHGENENTDCCQPLRSNY